MPLRWVFNGEIAASVLHEKMEAAIRAERVLVRSGKSTVKDASVAMMDQILAQIRKIVVVFK